MKLNIALGSGSRPNSRGGFFLHDDLAGHGSVGQSSAFAHFEKRIGVCKNIVELVLAAFTALFAS